LQLVAAYLYVFLCVYLLPLICYTPTFAFTIQRSTGEKLVWWPACILKETVVLVGQLQLPKRLNRAMQSILACY